MEKFLRCTADYTLRKCYIKLGGLELAEKAFVEVYVAFSKNTLSSIVLIRFCVLDYEINRVCNYYL